MHSLDVCKNMDSVKSMVVYSSAACIIKVDGSKFPVGVVSEKLIHAHSSTCTSPTLDIPTYPVVSTVQCTEVHTRYHVDDTIPL